MKFNYFKKVLKNQMKSREMIRIFSTKVIILNEVFLATMLVLTEIRRAELHLGVDVGTEVLFLFGCQRVIRRARRKTESQKRNQTEQPAGVVHRCRQTQVS